MAKYRFKPVLVALLLLINFLVFIGEITQYLFISVVKIILKVFKLILLPFHYLSKGPKFVIRKIKRIKVRKLFKVLFFWRSSKIVYFILGIIITTLIIFSYESYFFIKNLPSPSNIGKVNFPLTTHILDRNGKLLYDIYREENRTKVKIASLPKFVEDATVAVEDKDFYRHKGVSIMSGIVRAVRDTFIQKKLQGGSTITQQLVKSALLTPERTLQRKLKEMVLAIWTEKMFTKKEILEMYLNQVPYGGASYGIEEASRTYFGKNAKDLTLTEAALLAGLPQAPSAYSPYVNPDLTIQRRNEVLKLMYEQKYITQTQYKDSLDTKLAVIPPKTTIKAPHFVFYVKSQLENMFDIRRVEEGGLRVITSLDLNIQNKAEEILKEYLDQFKNLNVNNGAILITKPSTGEILAMVGAVDYFADGFGSFNTTTALRQPGSSIKPLMYSLALTKGYTAATIIDDSPITYNVVGGESYTPLNYDNRFNGKVSLRQALANSYNVPAVKVLDTLGVNNFIQHAQNMGLQSLSDPSRYGLSVTLGGAEVKMIEMAQAFGVFANQGDAIGLNSFMRIDDMNGDKLLELKPDRKKVLDTGISFIISDILSDNAARTSVFGPNSLLQIPGYHVAVKTGTTNSKRDNWTIGYTPNFLVVVWVGNNDNQPMSQYLESGATGAAPIWNKMMTYLLQNYQGRDMWFKKPENIIEKKCLYGKPEYFIKGTENSVSCANPYPSVTITPTP